MKVALKDSARALSALDPTALMLRRTFAGLAPCTDLYEVLQEVIPVADAMAPLPYDWRLTVSMLEGSSTVHVWDLAPARRRDEVALPTRAQCMTSVGQCLVIGLGDDVVVLERNR
ncbi:hypothetical protein ABZY81_29860 [Streptomyces sp. NPDC006514]|uniref:hypothetical protein n=1 Tax=Streptomyces sp. NPDC006514 TaxID=3154308 RepID=UPI0033BACE7D